ncbi:MAG: DUF3168 domain-containing protein [Tannerellaceae bacterium]|jgi:hypothetical protein|nr:DUF3168 domain-containing protein [Tannerellaceae bacterium]
MSGVSAGKFIYGALLNNTAVADIAGDKIFPNIVTKDITFPFIVYETKFTTDRTKDGGLADSVDVTISVVSDRHIESIELGEAVRSALDFQKSAEHGVQLCVCTSGESFAVNETTTVQELTFNILMR